MSLVCPVFLVSTAAAHNDHVPFSCLVQMSYDASGPHPLDLPRVPPLCGCPVTQRCSQHGLMLQVQNTPDLGRLQQQRSFASLQSHSSTPLSKECASQYPQRVSEVQTVPNPTYTIFSYTDPPMKKFNLGFIPQEINNNT
jgi:hypothetical protein